ncbi:unnamed protein product, partial [Polarella glacialis]
ATAGVAASSSNPGPASTAGGGASESKRREMAAKAAEARNSVPSGGSASTATAAPTAAPKVAAQPVPVVARMESLLHLVHCVFLSHGFSRADEASPGADLGVSPGPFRLHYVHESKPAVIATYVPVQRHLVAYASTEGSEDCPLRATVALGMAAASVQAKVDYLLLYPLLCRQLAPTLPAIPPEVLFGLLSSFSIPDLSKVGFASKALANAAFEDDVLWWRVATALPQSPQLCGAVDMAKSRSERGDTLPSHAYREIVRDEVQRAREEAEEQRRRREQAAAIRRQMQDPLMVQPPRRPQRPSPGSAFPGFGGPDDLMPGGGFMPFGGGRRDPFGGGRG